jgi:hypothetical protein
MRVKIIVFLLLCGAAYAEDGHFKAKYWTAVGMASGAAGVDLVTSQQLYARHPWCIEVGSPWLYGSKPGAVRQGLTMAVGTGVLALSGYWMHRSRYRWIRRMWAVPMAVVSEEHLRAGIQNTGACR